MYYFRRFSCFEYKLQVSVDKRYIGRKDYSDKRRAGLIGPSEERTVHCGKRPRSAWPSLHSATAGAWGSSFPLSVIHLLLSQACIRSKREKTYMMEDPIRNTSGREIMGGTIRRIVLVHSGMRGRTRVRYRVTAPRVYNFPPQKPHTAGGTVELCAGHRHYLATVRAVRSSLLVAPRHISVFTLFNRDLPRTSKVWRPQSLPQAGQ